MASKSKTARKSSVAKTVASPFAAALAAIRVESDKSSSAIFRVASMIHVILPANVKDADNNVIPSDKALKSALRDPKARGAIRRHLVSLVPGKVAEVNAGNVRIHAAYTADIQNMDRALHVASIVAGLPIMCSAWEGATFSVDVNGMLASFNKATDAKHPLRLFAGEDRIIFGKAVPESIVVAVGSKGVKAFKASFANLVAAFPKVGTGKGKQRSGDALTVSYDNSAKAIRTFITAAAGKFSEAQRNDMIALAKELETAAGVAKTKLVKAKDKATKLPKPAADIAKPSANATKAA